MKITKRNIVFGILLILLIWICSAILIHVFISPTERGTFGDMFGAINALFSGLALFGIIISILIQQNELNLQRKELADTREEFKVNRITNILFKQIEYLNNIIDSAKFEIRDLETIHYKGIAINEFVANLEEIANSGNESSKILFLSYMESNNENIAKLITKVISSFKSFEELLSDANLKETDRIQMKKMLKSNLQSSFSDLLIFKSKSLKEFKSTDKSIREIEKGILKIEVERMMYILKFGREEEKTIHSKKK